MAGPRTRALFSTLFALSLVTSLTHARDYRYSDAHVHYVDFFQESEGMPRLLEAMDKGRVDHVMLSGVAVAKKWHEDEPKRPRYYAGDDAGAYWYSATDVIVAAAVKSLPAEQRRRVHPFLTGFNPTDKNADAHIRRMLELDPGLWQGIGEIFTRHDDLTALTYGDVPRANNEALARVYHLAAEFDLPVLLHANVTSKRERNPLYLAEIEEPLRNHPHVRFIWAHAGTSMEIHRHQKKLDFLLPTFGVCYSATRTSTSTCPGRCCARTCWTSRASPIRSGWHWSSGFRNASCSVPMWSASSTACPS